jgi:thiol-disulfide isomerase/thioredoxin
VGLELGDGNEGRRGPLTIVFVAIALIAFVVFTYREVLFAPSEWTTYRPGQVVMPDAVLTDLKEKPVKFSDVISGPEEFVVLSFWATWCQPCLYELPIIFRKADEYQKQGIKIILVNYDSPSPAIALPQVWAWRVAQKTQFPTFFDFNEQLMKPLSPPGFPFAVGMKKDRSVLWTKDGILDWENVSEVVKRFRR